LINYYGLDKSLIPEIVPLFGQQGRLSSTAANELGLKPGIPVTYRAGDQPNNALSLNVLNPGEVASTAGTSGVIYGVAGENIFDQIIGEYIYMLIANDNPNVGVFIIISMTGIQYSWLKQRFLVILIPMTR
jgi:xylulokinase